jgi:hypothetical protein
MTMLLRISSLLGVLLLGCNNSISGFVPGSLNHGSHSIPFLSRSSRSSVKKLFYSSTNGDDASSSLDGESSEQRMHRMELVRSLQQQFYADETGNHPAQHGIFQNMPIWRDDYVSKIHGISFLVAEYGN